MKSIRLILTLGALFLLAACGGGGGDSSGGGGVITPVSNTTLKLTLSLAGAGVKGVETTIALPNGVTAPADASGTTLDGVLTQTIGGTNTSLSGKFTPASAGSPATLKLVLLNADPNFVMNAGNIMTVSLTVAAGTAVPNAAAFTLSNSKLFDIDGAVVSGAALSLN